MIGNAILHTLRYFLGVEQAQTQTSAAERDLLRRFVGGRALLVEIGVFEGVTTACLADAIDKEATLYGVDPFVPGRLGICWSRLIARSMTKRYRDDGRVVLIEKLSHEAAKDVPERIDFIFIDGDHSYDGIHRDWQLLSERVVEGGIVALHDALPRTGGEPQAGSERYFADVIVSDSRFRLLATEGVLAVLERRAR
jgi:predicted O-methyltransferase YrrM